MDVMDHTLGDRRLAVVLARRTRTSATSTSCSRRRRQRDRRVRSARHAAAVVIDEVAELTNRDEFDAIRDRYDRDDRLRVPADITTFVNEQPVSVHLDLE